MNPLTNPAKIRADLPEFHFTKRRGQNFLIDASVPAQMAALFDKTAAVLEIGPGFGALTYALCTTAGHVAALELDKNLVPMLRKNLPFDHFTLREGDALKTDLGAFLRESAGDGLATTALCANLPYAHTAPLLTKILNDPALDPCVVMVQREVAERILAAPGSRNAGSFTLFCALRATATKLLDVSSGCFMPQPKVESTVLVFRRHQTPPCPPERMPALEKLIRASFAMRRKTLRTGLSASLALDRAAVIAAIERCGFNADVRGETLTIADWLNLLEQLEMQA